MTNRIALCVAAGLLLPASAVPYFMQRAQGAAPAEVLLAGSATSVHFNAVATVPRSTFAPAAIPALPSASHRLAQRATKHASSLPTPQSRLLTSLCNSSAGRQAAAQGSTACPRYVM